MQTDWSDFRLCYIRHLRKTKKIILTPPLQIHYRAVKLAEKLNSIFFNLKGIIFAMGGGFCLLS